MGSEPNCSKGNQWKLEETNLLVRLLTEGASTEVISQKIPSRTCDGIESKIKQEIASLRRKGVNPPNHNVGRRKTNEPLTMRHAVPVQASSSAPKSALSLLHVKALCQSRREQARWIKDLQPTRNYLDKGTENKVPSCSPRCQAKKKTMGGFG